MIPEDGRIPVQEAAQRLADEMFLGGPAGQFDQVGRATLVVLLENGLHPWSRVLDFGCGALRGGYWLMSFLDPGCYFGIEPNAHRLQRALDEIVGEQRAFRAKPRFSNNDSLDFSVFDATFDFVVARSVWTHASKWEIEQMLDQFVATSTSDGTMLASFLPADETHPDYQGDHGLRHDDRPGATGLLAHGWDWIEQAASTRGLSARQIDGHIINGQVWARVDRQEQAA